MQVERWLAWLVELAISFRTSFRRIRGVALPPSEGKVPPYLPPRKLGTYIANNRQESTHLVSPARLPCLSPDSNSPFGLYLSLGM
jgi:hypothetical protein